GGAGARTTSRSWTTHPGRVRAIEASNIRALRGVIPGGTRPRARSFRPELPGVSPVRTDGRLASGAVGCSPPSACPGPALAEPLPELRGDLPVGDLEQPAPALHRDGLPEALRASEVPAPAPLLVPGARSLLLAVDDLDDADDGAPLGIVRDPVLRE